MIIITIIRLFRLGVSINHLLSNVFYTEDSVHQIPVSLRSTAV
jgi:hypothetical protein